MWDCSSKAGEELGTSTNGGVSDCRLPNLYSEVGNGAVFEDLRDPRPIATARYELYYIWCKQYDPASKIMLIDFRDSYFVTDPFDGSNGRPENIINRGDIHLFAEHNPSVTIKTSNHNKKWIQGCYGNDHLEKIKDER